jgi:hypothetical protein
MEFGALWEPLTVAKLLASIDFNHIAQAVALQNAGRSLFPKHNYDSTDTTRMTSLHCYCEGTLRVVSLAALAVMMTGCSGGTGLSGMAPVTGKVTYKDQPVDGAIISFIGEGTTRTATAVSSADGSYKLMTLDVEGAMPGQYTVVVDKTESSAGASKLVTMEEAEKVNALPVAAPKKLLPEKYGDPTKTPLKFPVKDGPNVIDLKLEE